MQNNWKDGIHRKLRAIIFARDLDGNYKAEKDELDEFIETEIIERLIEEIQNHAEGFGQYCDTGADMDWRCRSECTKEAVNRLRAKWLGKENND